MPRKYTAGFARFNANEHIAELRTTRRLCGTLFNDRIDNLYAIICREFPQLGYLCLSFKYPDTFDLKRNEVFIKERMKAITAELAPLLQSEDWEVFSSDEVRMDQEAVIRKCWLKKGERTIIKVDRKKQSQSYIGFLNQKNYQCHLYEMPWQNSDEVLRAMKEFLTAYPEKKICIVWDNAAFHKSKAIRDQLEKGGIMERVHLIAMPPYAPDYNPIEHVWNTAKQAVSNIQRDTFEQTEQAFSDFVASRPFSYSFSTF